MLLMISYLIDDQYKSQLTQVDYDDTDKDEFLVEKKDCSILLFLLLVMVKQMRGKKIH